MIRKVLYTYLVVALVTWVRVDAQEDCGEFECPSPNGQFADPCNCHRFYICTDGRAFKNPCPSRLLWDDIDKICKFEHEAVCGPVKEEDRKSSKKDEEEDIDRAPKCDQSVCSLPFCYCSKKGDKAPIEPSKLTQFIMVTVDGAINGNNYEYFVDAFNSSDSNVKVTFFLEHEYSDYYLVEKLYTWGHELALSSVTGNNLAEADKATWQDEVRTLRNILEKYANVHPEDILGFRAPASKPGKNIQYDVLVEEGFVWDSSVATAPLKVPVWPYTLDYRIPHRCKHASCPTKAYPGLWEIPLNAHFVGDNTGGQCSYLDQCVFTHQTSDDVFSWLKEDFLRNYEGNKAPYMIPLHTNWFLGEHQHEGLKKFINWTRSNLDDVFYGTATELLLWMTDENLENKRPEGLELSREISCNNPETCQLPHVEPNGINTLRYMRTCSTCPNKYPWIETPSDDDEQDADVS